MKKFMAALLAFAAVILFAGCGGKTVDTDSTLQGESIDADAQTNSDGQASKVISAYYLGIGLDKESRWKMTEARTAIISKTKPPNMTPTGIL